MINAYIIPDPDLTIQTTCYFFKPYDIGQGCKNFINSSPSIVGGGISAVIGWSVGGPFGAVLGATAESFGSCILGAAYVVIKNCIESYGEI